MLKSCDQPLPLFFAACRLCQTPLMPCVRRYTVTWYRRRGQLGLISPWQTGSSNRCKPQP